MAKVYGFVGKFGSNGSGNGQFNFGTVSTTLRPGGIAVDADYIYIADTQNHRIQVFNRTTFAYVTQFGSYGTGNGQFIRPVDVVVDGSNVFVLDLGVISTPRVQKFVIATYTYVATASFASGQVRAMDGDTTHVFVLHSTDDLRYYMYTKASLLLTNDVSITSFSYGPTDVAVDSTYVYVNNYDIGSGRRMLKTVGTGTAFTCAATSGLAVDSNYLYLPSNHRVAANDISTLAFTDYFGAYGDTDGYLNAPGKLAVYDNKLYVVDTGNSRVQIFDWSDKVAPAAPSGLTLSCAAGKKILVGWTDNS